LVHLDCFCRVHFYPSERCFPRCSPLSFRSDVSPIFPPFCAPPPIRLAARLPMAVGPFLEFFLCPLLPQSLWKSASLGRYSNVLPHLYFTPSAFVLFLSLSSPAMSRRLLCLWRCACGCWWSCIIFDGLLLGTLPLHLVCFHPFFFKIRTKPVESFRVSFLPSFPPRFLLVGSPHLPLRPLFFPPPTFP